jgi:exo-beta-1,3-glucanase (GH17 family)
MKYRKRKVRHQYFLILICLIFIVSSCNPRKHLDAQDQNKSLKASEILGNQNFLAISYGGYRTRTRDDQPTIGQIKDDMKLLSAIGVKILRTYNTHLDQAENILKSIKQLKKEEPDFEMYVMLGTWIKCKNAETEEPDHSQEDSLANQLEIERGVRLANKYQDIVKVISVGNEAMVHWATGYYVEPVVILRWVNHLQELKKNGKLDQDLWITSSDNFASWGGGSKEYHTPDLKSLIQAVDYISLHTYPFHDTHYNPEFWGLEEDELELDKFQQNSLLIQDAVEYSKNQYYSTSNYVHSISMDKPIHIGETGWSTFSNELFGAVGTRAADELKAGIYFKKMREWTNANNISCFYFEAFDETWKDAENPGGSENHFGLFTVSGKSKYALWEYFDRGAFQNLTRDHNQIQKTFQGRIDSLYLTVHEVPVKK